MAILYFKAFHLIGMVAWFAGLFYLVRLFVYHVEAAEKPQMERDILSHQYNIMEWRVYKIICTPAMLITWFCGLSMLYLHGAEWFKVNSWMHLKLVFLLAMTAYHGFSKGIIRKLESNQQTFNSFQFRMMNELPTLFLVSIVLLAVLRNNLNFMYAFAGVLAFGFLLFSIIKAVKNRAASKTK